MRPASIRAAVETPRLGAVGAAVEQPGTALEDALLLGERGIKRHAGGLLHDQRQIGRVEHVERRAERHRREVDGIDRIVRREVARIEPQQALAKLPHVEGRIDQQLGEIRLMIAITDNQEFLAREVALEARKESRIARFAFARRRRYCSPQAWRRRVTTRWCESARN
jgi:hypothetical protein